MARHPLSPEFVQLLAEWPEQVQWLASVVLPLITQETRQQVTHRINAAELRLKVKEYREAVKKPTSGIDFELLNVVRVKMEGEDPADKHYVVETLPNLHPKIALFAAQEAGVNLLKSIDLQRSIFLREPQEIELIDPGKWGYYLAGQSETLKRELFTPFTFNTAQINQADAVMLVVEYLASRRMIDQAVVDRARLWVTRSQFGRSQEKQTFYLDDYLGLITTRFTGQAGDELFVISYEIIDDADGSLGKYAEFKAQEKAQAEAQRKQSEREAQEAKALFNRWKTQRDIVHMCLVEPAHVMAHFKTAATPVIKLNLGMRLEKNMSVPTQEWVLSKSDIDSLFIEKLPPGWYSFNGTPNTWKSTQHDFSILIEYEDAPQEENAIPRFVTQELVAELDAFRIENRPFNPGPNTQDRKVAAIRLIPGPDTITKLCAQEEIEVEQFTQQVLMACLEKTGRPIAFDYYENALVSFDPQLAFLPDVNPNEARDRKQLQEAFKVRHMRAGTETIRAKGEKLFFKYIRDEVRDEMRQAIEAAKRGDVYVFDESRLPEMSTVYETELGGKPMTLKVIAKLDRSHQIPRIKLFLQKIA